MKPKGSIKMHASTFYGGLAVPSALNFPLSGILFHNTPYVN
ncbi:MAG TPA: hypothetical protein PLV31_00580 [Gammaproteobacteria bacterium]|nr:hypothetical protein [Gammaproteobacteria bacterium]HRA42166.1 hypothetical protein [Gammaproteobacteria bacterium]